MTKYMRDFVASTHMMASSAEVQAVITQTQRDTREHDAWTRLCLALTDAAQALEDVANDIDGIYAVPDDVYELPLPQPVCVSPGIYKRFVP